MVIKIQGIPVQNVVVEKKEDVKPLQVALTVTKILALSMLLELVFSMFGGANLYVYVFKGVYMCLLRLFSVQF